MQAHKIIIIHPGSCNLRIGRASDLNPITVIHAIGRRRKSSELAKDNRQQHTAAPVVHQETLLPALQTEALVEFSEIYADVRKTLPKPTSGNERVAKRSRISSPTQQIIAFNKLSKPKDLKSLKDEEEDEKSEDYEDDKIIRIDHTTKENVYENEVIFDQRLRQLDSQTAAAYNIHFPMRRGELNLHANVGGSMSSLLADLEEIWRYAICQLMKIPLSALATHNAVLVVPDIYNRSHIRELVSLILQRLGFRACFVLQDHVAATFGAGLGYACVVDVGDQKCSISCVDDGISQADTRLRLPFGGGDVTRVFYTLLEQHAFPYKECSVERSLVDASLITQLKERSCHLFTDTYSGIQEHIFEVKSSRGNKCLRYTMQIADECVVAPLALFHTELLNVTHCKKRQARIQLNSSQQPDSEDCFDADYIRDTGRMRNGMRCDQLEGNMPLAGDNADDELVVVDNYDVESTTANNAKIVEQKADIAYTGSGQVVNLDQAIMRSIERCPSEELKRKMYGCVLLVGGGVKVPGFAKFLEKKLQLQLANNNASSQRMFDTTIEVNVFMREMDAAMIAWKGAAIMSCLESSPELWIYPSEWEKNGLRILREKAPFIW